MIRNSNIAGSRSCWCGPSSNSSFSFVPFTISFHFIYYFIHPIPSHPIDLIWLHYFIHFHVPPQACRPLSWTRWWARSWRALTLTSTERSTLRHLALDCLFVSFFLSLFLCLFVSLSLCLLFLFLCFFVFSLFLVSFGFILFSPSFDRSSRRQWQADSWSK